MSKKASFSAKALIATACTFSLAATPLAQASAYSIEYAPDYQTTFGIAGSDGLFDAYRASDGKIVVVGYGEINNSGKDQGIAMKFNADGSQAWDNLAIVGNTSVNDSLIDAEELPDSDGTIIAYATSNNGYFVEIDKNGHVADNVNSSNLALDGFTITTPSHIVGISNENHANRIEILERRIQNGSGDISYSVLLSTNYDQLENFNFYTIQKYDETGYIATGYSNSENAPYIFVANNDSQGPSPIKLDSNITIYKTAVAQDGNIVGVGQKDGKLAAIKFSSSGNIIKEVVIDGEGGFSSFRDVAILQNGDIIASGRTGYVNGDVKNLHNTTENQFDAVISHFDSKFNLISTQAFGGNYDDTFDAVIADKDGFFVSGASSSTDYDVANKVGNEYYSVFAHFSTATFADVQFKIDGNLPENATAPEDGEYQWNADGSNNLPTPANGEKQIFSGWYTDKDLNNPLSETPTNDLSLYGKYFDVERYDATDTKTNCDKDEDVSLACINQKNQSLAAGETSKANTPYLPNDLRGSIDQKGNLDAYPDLSFQESNTAPDSYPVFCTRANVTIGDTTKPYYIYAKSANACAQANIVASSSDTAGLTGRWESEDEKIATVDQNGRVTGVSAGKVRIGFVLRNTDGEVVYAYILNYEITEAKAEAEALTNPDTLDNFSALLLVVVISSALLGFGLATKANRR
jgi:hypothetical protein